MRAASIAEVTLGRSGLRVLVELVSSNSDAIHGIEIHFEVPRGFRYLDEGDLIAYWQSGEFTPSYRQGHCLFEMLSGGWLEQECQHPGMLTTTESLGTFREWFICTGNGCMNVLSVNPPLVREFADI